MQMAAASTSGIIAEIKTLWDELMAVKDEKEREEQRHRDAEKELRKKYCDIERRMDRKCQIQAGFHHISEAEFKSITVGMRIATWGPHRYASPAVVIKVGQSFYGGGDCIQATVDAPKKNGTPWQYSFGRENIAFLTNK